MTLPVGSGVHRISKAEVTKFVALSLEGEHCVGAKPHAAIHSRGEMNAQKGKTGIRYLQEQRAHTHTQGLNQDPFERS